MGTYWRNEIEPYDDVTMTYDSNKHRYELTIAAVDNEFNANLVEYAGSFEDAQAILREISSDVYKFIYKYNRRDFRKLQAVEHGLAKNGDWRDAIRDAMLDYARATIRNGYLLDKDLSWVNPETAQVMDLSNIPAIAPDAIDGLMAYNVLHKGPYTFTIADDDYRDGY